MAKTIEQEIADLEKAINSPATPDAQKGVMKGILEKLKAKQGSTPAPKKAETKAPAPKKAEPKTEKKSSSEDDYDCDTLIEKEKTRRAKLKERALKKANAPKSTQATKNRDAIEKVGDKLEASIEKRLETGKVSKNELTKLIDETKALLKMLESYLDKVN
jgi:hypothetical protein